MTQSAAKNDLQRFPRYEFTDVDYSTLRACDKNGKFIAYAYIKNLSANGVCFLIPLSENTKFLNVFKTGEMLALHMAPLGSRAITCTGKIVWSHETPTEILVGLEFEAMPLVFQDRLRREVNLALDRILGVEERTQNEEPHRKIIWSEIVHKLIWVSIFVGLVCLESVWFTQVWKSFSK